MKLLFMRMSGEQVNYGKMESLKLIASKSIMDKRIGYLGLYTLFDDN